MSALEPLGSQHAMAEIDSDFAETTADETRETTGVETDAVVLFAMCARIPVYGDPCLLALDWVTLGWGGRFRATSWVFEAIAWTARMG